MDFGHGAQVSSLWEMYLRNRGKLLFIPKFAPFRLGPLAGEVYHWDAKVEYCAVQVGRGEQIVWAATISDPTKSKSLNPNT